MFNVFRNNISKVNSKAKLSISNIFTKNFLNYNTNKNLFNNISKYNIITSNKTQLNNVFHNNKINENGLSKFKINKIISYNFTTNNAKSAKKCKKSIHEAIIDQNPQFYNIVIEEIRNSKNLNDDEKNALIEKINNFSQSHTQLNNERKGKEFGEYHSKIVQENDQEADEEFKEKMIEAWENYLYSNNFILYIWFLKGLFIKKYL